MKRVFTVELAKHYLNRNHCDRPLSGRRTQQLGEIMRLHKFDGSATYIDVDHDDNLKGGQHVLAAIVDTGIEQELNFTITVGHFPALILYSDKKEYVVVTHPDRIDKGREFAVLTTNIEIK